MQCVTIIIFYLSYEFKDTVQMMSFLLEKTTTEIGNRIAKGIVVVFEKYTRIEIIKLLKSSLKLRSSEIVEKSSFLSRI